MAVILHQRTPDPDVTCNFLPFNLILASSWHIDWR